MTRKLTPGKLVLASHNAGKVREIEAKAQKGKLGPTNRVKFQVIAFLVREERARVKADTEITVMQALSGG